MDMGMIMMWLGPIIQAFFAELFGGFFAGWFDAPVEAVEVVIDQVAPMEEVAVYLGQAAMAFV